MKPAPASETPGGSTRAGLGGLRVALICPLALLLLWWLAFDAQWVSQKLLPSPWSTPGPSTALRNLERCERYSSPIRRAVAARRP